MSNDFSQDTPVKWTGQDKCGTLPGVREKHGGLRDGPQPSDWIWGPKAPATRETVAALEACVAEFKSIAVTDDARLSGACAHAIAELVLAFGRVSGAASTERPAASARELPVLAEAAR